MPKLELTLETVTPLFLGGADSRGAPELRPPAFRGAMRYWLRAALGGVIGDDNLPALHELESAVFGSTDFGSPIQLRLYGDLKSDDNKILPHKQGREAGQRKAFNAGQSFNLTMRQFRENDEAIWQAACATLQFTLLFGGVGLRSRRGFGTLRVVHSSEPELVKPMPSTLAEWKQYIEDTLTQAFAAARTLAQSNKIKLTELPKGPSHYPCAGRSNLVRIVTALSDDKGKDIPLKSAMDSLTQLMYRMPQNQALGGITPRQASPLWMRPIKIENGYGLLLAVLASQLKERTDYSFVKKFLDEKFKGNDLPVKGWNV